MGRAARELGIDILKRHGCRLQHDREMIQHIRGFRRQRLLVAAHRRDHRLDRLLAEFLRRALRAAQRNLDPPRTLGPEEPPPPDGVLPGAMGELTGMVQIVVRFLGMDGTVGEGLHGTGIGTTAVTAKACVAISPEDALDRLEPGDVLVVAATTPAFNLVLSLAGGVVTAEGGPMSHAAVLARELGIPAVVGAHAALTDIPDGAMVEVDPVAGEVRLVQ